MTTLLNCKPSIIGSSFVGVLLIVGVGTGFSKATARPQGETLSASQLNSITGAQCPGCELTTVGDCYSPPGYNPPCSCVQGLNGCGTSKYYLGAPRRVCVSNPPSNNQFCDEGTVTCWVERDCFERSQSIFQSCLYGKCENAPEDKQCSACEGSVFVLFTSEKSDDACLRCGE